MRQIIKGDRKVLKYTWTERPSMLRYHAKAALPMFYPADKFATTDYASGITVVYQKTRDRGCFEVTHIDSKVAGPLAFPAYKKFYIDYSPWYEEDPGEVDVVAMCLDDDYQTLFVLMRQQRVNVPRVGLWLTRINLLTEKIDLPTDLPGISFCEVYDVPSPDGRHLVSLSDRLTWLCSANWRHCEVAGTKALNSLYNLVVTQGKIIFTIPYISFGSHEPSDIELPRSAANPAIIQAAFILDSRTGMIEGSGILGAVSSYSEVAYSPTPDNWPERPLKVGMSVVDDCIVWSLSTISTIPIDLYEEHLTYCYGSTEIADFVKNAIVPPLPAPPDSWRSANLPDRYWQLYRREAVLLREFIAELQSGKSTPLKPILCEVRNQFYIQHPPAFDLLDGHAIERAGREMLAKWSRGFVVYTICYHNFHRKFIRRFVKDTPPVYEVTDHEVGDFIYNAPGECLDVDGVTKYYQIFGLENLSSYTYMTNVRLTAPSGSSLRFGLLSGTPSKPSMTSISWSEIAPHTEVLFTAIASDDINNEDEDEDEGVGLQYGLEIR